MEVEDKAARILSAKIILYALVLSVVGFFYWTVFTYSMNVPYHDDYDAVLNFLMNYLESDNLKSKLDLFFSRYNEHRLVFTRFVTLMTYQLSGSVNFRILILVGSLSLIGLIVVLFKVFDCPRNKFLYFTPVVFLLFQFQYWEAVYWGMASLQNLYVLLFAFLSIYLITKSSKQSFTFSIFFAVLAVFTSGNGFFVPFLCIIVIIYMRRHYQLFIFTPIIAAVAVFYFSGYIDMSQHPSVLVALEDPLKTVKYLFTFIGSSMGNSSYFGLLVTAYFIHLISKKYYKENTAVFLCFIFLFATAVSVALTRSVFGLDQALASRYKINSVLFIILIYISMIEIADVRHANGIFCVFVIFSVLFNLNSLNENFAHVSDHRRNLGLSSLEQGITGGGLIHWNKNFARFIMDRSLARGIYRMPSLKTDEYLSMPAHFRLPESEAPNVIVTIDSVDTSGPILKIKGWGILDSESSKDSKIFVVLSSPGKTYVWDTFPEKRSDVTASLKSFNFDDSGFLALILKESIEKGDYTIGIYVKKKNRESLRSSDRVIHLE